LRLEADNFGSRNATYGVGYPNFDYSMRYPVPSGEDDKPNEEEKPETPKIEKPPPKVE
jgi:hypothetical protein